MSSDRRPTNRTLRLDGSACRNARERRGLSREGLADQSRGPHPLSVATIKRAETGHPVYLESARRLAELLGVEVQKLLPPSTSEVGGLVQRPSVAIAVLPFRTIGLGETDHYLAEGITEGLVDRLARWWFPVLSRTCTWDLKPDDAKLLEVCAQKGVAYFTEGTVQRAGGELRASVRLVDAASGHLVWAANYCRVFSSVLKLQDELASAVVSQMMTQVVNYEGTRLARRDPSDLEAWQLGLRGSWHFYRGQQADNLRARDYLIRALQADSAQPLAWYMLVLTHQRELLNQWSDHPAASLRSMKNVVEEFARVHSGDPLFYLAAAYTAIYSGQRNRAMDSLSRAIDLDPNLGAAYALYGQALAMASDPDPAVEQFEIALRLGPGDKGNWMILASMALAHFVAGRYEDGVKWANQALGVCPSAAFCHGVLATCHAHLGHLEEARSALFRMKELEPSISLGGFGPIMASTDPEIARRYVAGLQMAGLNA